MDVTLRQLKRDHLAGDETATARYIAALERAVGGVVEFPHIEVNKDNYRRGIVCLDCGTMLLSLGRHNFVTCECCEFYKVNNSGCFIDGGDEYTRCGGNPEKMVSIRIKVK